MNWLDALRDRGREASRNSEAEKPPAIRRAPVKTIRFWFQIAPASEGYPGAVEQGCYSVEDGVLVMRDPATGKALQQRHALRPGDDAHVIAGALARAAWASRTGNVNFDRPLNYPRAGWA